MTVGEILNQCQAVKPSQYGRDALREWLNEVEKRIEAEILKTHEGAPEEAFAPYTQATESKTPLAAGPYESLYLYWLYAMIDYHNGEFTRYNNHAAMFSQAYDAYGKAYHQAHMPLQRARIANVRGW